MNQGPKNKAPAVGTAALNLAEFASAVDQKEFDLRLPLLLSAGVAEPRPLLCVCALEFFLMFISFLLVPENHPCLFKLLPYGLHNLDSSVIHISSVFTVLYLKFVISSYRYHSAY